MKGDGRIGGGENGRLLKARGQMAEVTAARSKAHFTVRGFTAATGEPVMCAIIFAASEMMQELQLGINIQAPMWSKGMTASSEEATMALANDIPVAQFASFTVRLSPIHLL